MREPVIRTWGDLLAALAFLVGVVLLLASLRCSSSSASANPSEGAVWNEVGGAYCARLQACFPDAFAARYADVNDCVSRNAPKNAGAASGCTQSQVDACRSDVANESCAASIDASKLPTSCNGC